MCGICGVVQVAGAPGQVVAPDRLDRMTDAMTHRGPDDRGTHHAPGIALGVRRLSIVDIAGGHQPCFGEDGAVAAIHNGELYNHAALREQLRAAGHRFTGRCDTEVLPHLYERDGPDFPTRLRGMWGLAVWDAARRRAVISRDRLGVKPLYYAHVGDVLVFASELRALLASGLIPAALDFEAIAVYLTLGYFPAPATPLRAARKLPPGCSLVVADGRVRVERYWSYPRPAPDPSLTIDDAAEGLLEHLDEAVRMRLMSDVPLGSMLSGGLDSTLVTALMAKHTSGPVHTFAVGFEGHPNELAAARRAAHHLGAEHHELRLPGVMGFAGFRESIGGADEPVADLSALGFQSLSAMAARTVKVALSGQGADELLGGYTKHRAARLAAAWRHIPGPAGVLPALISRHGPRPARRAAATLAAPTPAERLLAMSGRLDDPLRAALFRGPLAAIAPGAALRVITALTTTPAALGIDLRAPAPARPGGQLPAALDGDLDSDPVAATLFLDGQLALVDDMLQYFDRASMAHSLEVRVPFLDHEVVEFCATIPSRFKVTAGLRTKYVLKRAARGLVPERIIHRRKVGFLRPASGGWLRGELGARGGAGELLFAGAPRFAEFLDPGVVRALAAAHRDGAGGGRDVHLLIAVLVLEVWLESYLPSALGSGG
ncbi:asparagine synthase (glutamine-hydrolyzing) [Dactylosporangium matsuzakiense]